MKKYQENKSNLHMCVFMWMGWADRIYLLGTVDGDSGLVWGAPGWDVEGLFLGGRGCEKV